MSRQPQKSEPLPPANLEVARQDAERQIQERIDAGNALIARPISSQEQLDELWSDQTIWTEYNSELLRKLFDNAEYQMQYDRSFAFGVVGGRTSFEESVDNARDPIKKSVRKLESLKSRLPLINEKLSVHPPARPDEAIARSDVKNKNVFIVHGHDELAVQTVARFLEKLDLNPVILSEQANQGKTIIEKLEHHGLAAFAVVLLTPDDVGATKADSPNLRPRARQNVVLELGYFFGLLGRGHVAALHQGDLELPSDIHGLVYIRYDSAGAWKLLLAREMQAAGLEVNMNKAI